MRTLKESGSTRILTFATALALLVLPAATSITSVGEVVAGGQHVNVLHWD